MNKDQILEFKDNQISELRQRLKEKDTVFNDYYNKTQKDMSFMIQEAFSLKERLKESEENNVRVREQANEFFKSNQKLKQRLKEAGELVKDAIKLNDWGLFSRQIAWLEKAKKWERENEIQK